MIPKDAHDEESEEPAGNGVGQVEPLLTKTKRQSFGGLRRQLSEEELSGPGVQKMLLDEIDRLDSELVDAKKMADRFHEVDKEVAILREQAKPRNALELISTASLTVGSVALGLVYGIEDNPSLSWVVLAGGVILIGIGLWAKKVRL